MTRQDVEALALAHRAARKVVLWGRLDVYKLTSKVFATCSVDDELSFKASEILYEILVRDGPGRPAQGFVPGAWVTMPLAQVEPADAAEWIARSYDYAAAGLTKKKRTELGLG